MLTDKGTGLLHVPDLLLACGGGKNSSQVPCSQLLARVFLPTLGSRRSNETEETAIFLAQAGYRLMHGANLHDTLNEIAPEWALKKANSVLSENAVEAISKLGPACSISSALPSVLYLAIKHGDDTETAFIENAMAGGDNCARGLALGILLGSANGLSSIPESWIKNLEAQVKLDQFLEQVSQTSQTERQTQN